MGESMGGGLLVSLAARHASLFHGLILHSPMIAVPILPSETRNQQSETPERLNLEVQALVSQTINPESETRDASPRDRRRADSQREKCFRDTMVVTGLIG